MLSALSTTYVVVVIVAIVLVFCLVVVNVDVNGGAPRARARARGVGRGRGGVGGRGGRGGKLERVERHAGVAVGCDGERPPRAVGETDGGQRRVIGESAVDEASDGGGAQLGEDDEAAAREDRIVEREGPAILGRWWR